MSNFVLLCWIIWHSEEKKAVKNELYSSKLLKAIFVIQSQNHLQLYSGELKYSLNFCLLGVCNETFFFFFSLNLIFKLFASFSESIIYTELGFFFVFSSDSRILLFLQEN